MRRPAYTPLTTIAPPGGEPGLGKALELQGVAADGEAAIYLANKTLAGTGAPDALEGARQLYATADEETRFACVKPGGAPSAKGCSGGTFNDSVGPNRSASLQGAISADGGRIYWTDSPNGPGPLYLRENPFAEGVECVTASAPCTLAVSAQGEALTGGGDKAQFWGAAADGSRAIFSVAGDLYEFIRAEEQTQLIAHSFLGVAGIGADAGRVYFASTAAIAGAGENSEGDEAQEGEPNLYLHEARWRLRLRRHPGGGRTRASPPTSPARSSKPPAGHTARVTPDGERLAFMSVAGPASTGSLGPTGYDNTDAAERRARTPRSTSMTPPPAAGREAGVRLLQPQRAATGGARIEDALPQLGSGLPPRSRSPRTPSTPPASSPTTAAGSSSKPPTRSSLRDTNGAPGRLPVGGAGRGQLHGSRPTFSGQNGGCVEPDLLREEPARLRIRRRQPHRAMTSSSAPLRASCPQTTAWSTSTTPAWAAASRRPGASRRAAKEKRARTRPKCRTIPPRPLRLFEGDGNVVEKPKLRCKKGKVRRHGRCVGRHRKKAQETPPQADPAPSPRRPEAAPMKRFAACLAACLVALVLSAPQADAFGLEGFKMTFAGSGGQPETQAGAHPYAFTTSFEVETVAQGGGSLRRRSDQGPRAGCTAGAGCQSPTQRRAAPALDFLTLKKGTGFYAECADSSVVGKTTVEVGELGLPGVGEAPVYSLEPSPGTVAKLGFWISACRFTVDLGLSEAPPTTASPA